MNVTLEPWAESLFRWIHASTGFIWSGCVIGLAFATARRVKDQHRGENAVARPSSRALSLLRWGATSTWITGMLLTLFDYYPVERFVRREVHLETRYGLRVDYVLATDEPVIGHAAAVLISLSCIGLAFVAYEVIWKALGKHARVAAAASYALLVLVLHLLSLVFTGRAVFMHAGAILGSTMAVNVWLRGGLVQGEALRRAEHDVYMCVPALLTMSATHSAALHDREDAWLVIAAVLAASWALTRALYGKTCRGDGRAYAVP